MLAPFRFVEALTASQMYGLEWLERARGTVLTFCERFLRRSFIDVTTIIVYFVAIGTLGFVISRRQVKQQDEHSDEQSYFLAERSVSWWAVAASLFASNIGAEHFVGLAGTSAYSGIAVGWFEWGAMVCLLALGYVFLPVYMTSMVTTTPEWIERRYNTFCRNFLVGLSLLLYLFTKISADLYAGQLLLSQLTGMNGMVATVVLILATSLYTVLGGLSAVIYTETVQTLILVTGGLALLAVGMLQVGGLPGLRQRLSGLGPMYFTLMRPSTDKDFPWTGQVLGFYCTALWYWGCDQVIVQRGLAARSIEHGRAGCVAGAVLKLLPGFIMVIPGMVARALMEERGVVSVDTPRQEYDSAFAWMVMNVMPPNGRGLLMAAMMSALMSSLASVFNSSGTLFTMNIYRVLRPAATPRELVVTGRLTVAVMGTLALLWLPVIPLLGQQLFLYMQKPTSLVVPPITCIFVWGLFLKSANAAGASVALLAGVGLGITRFTLEVINAVNTSRHGPGHEIMTWLTNINFMHFSLLNFLLSTAVLVAVSKLFADWSVAEDTLVPLMWHQGLYGALMRAYHGESFSAAAAAAASGGGSGSVTISVVSMPSVPHVALATDELADTKGGADGLAPEPLTSDSRQLTPPLPASISSSMRSISLQSANTGMETRSLLQASTSLSADMSAALGIGDGGGNGGGDGDGGGKRDRWTSRFSSVHGFHRMDSFETLESRWREMATAPRYVRTKWITDTLAVAIVVAFLAIIIVFR